MIKTFIFEILILILIFLNFFLSFFLPEDKKGKVLGILNSVFLTLGIFSFLVFKDFIGNSLGDVYLDEFSFSLKLLFFLAGLIGILGSMHFVEEELKDRKAEYYLFILTSILGMSLLVSSKNFLLFFVCFELMSIPLYILSGIKKYDTLAPEVAIKFFLIGAFSAGLMFFGISLIYGATGALDYVKIKETSYGVSPLFAAGLVFLIAGIGFKIASFPFHSWVPDTYEGAPETFVAFLSVAPKAAGLGALFRIIFEVLPPGAYDFLLLIVVLSFFSMFIGNLLALPQKNLKRMLAYSSIAHIGYILVGVAAYTREGISMVIFYLFTYLFSNMGAFLFVEIVRGVINKTDIDDLKGLSQKAPVLSLSMLIILLSLGGIPPVAGFWAKLYVFLAGVHAGLWYLALWGAILTIVALFYYLMVAKRIYIESSDYEFKAKIPFGLKLSMIICVSGILFFGFYPKPLVDFSYFASNSFLP
ncbi:MAG: NADH-quinone oxidoreductase subunit N [Candidatus Hydrothermales bacterium]